MMISKRYLLMPALLFLMLAPIAAQENAVYFTNVTIQASSSIRFEVVTPALGGEWMLQSADSLAGPWSSVEKETNWFAFPVDRPERRWSWSRQFPFQTSPETLWAVFDKVDGEVCGHFFDIKKCWGCPQGAGWFVVTEKVQAASFKRRLAKLLTIEQK